MPSSTYTRPLAFFLTAAALLSQTEAAAPPAGNFCSSLWLPKGAIVNGTHVLGAHDTSDGCPVGWVECSTYTCYPLDGSTCCSDGNFCEAGYYCDSGGCCENGQICGGPAPPPSTIINGGTFTSITTARATTPIATTTFSTARPPTSTSSTDFGTIPANTPTANSAPAIPTGVASTAGSPAPTSGIGIQNGAAPLGAQASLWLACLAVVVMVIA
ncbi:hypothetical protein LXA43DRAFT_1058567 [Ganoderma leucocontextum]|nr:hypothetical protein LXA43DRAFT_1058567 [Ganoderma leucocontextum]